VATVRNSPLCSLHERRSSLSRQQSFIRRDRRRRALVLSSVCHSNNSDGMYFRNAAHMAISLPSQRLVVIDATSFFSDDDQDDDNGEDSDNDDGDNENDDDNNDSDFLNVTPMTLGTIEIGLHDDKLKKRRLEDDDSDEVSKKR
jgi:hypothetical protein